MPITPGQAFLSLPAGLTEADYPVADNLLDYTPPDVRWQAPLAPTGENIFANYIKAYPDLLKDYNRRLARPLGSPGSLPVNRYGAPISMAEYGYQHWGSLGGDEGRTLTKAPGIWGDPGRSPYLPYYYPGEPIEIKEDFTEEQIEEAEKINQDIAEGGGSQIITSPNVNLTDLLIGGDTTVDDTVVDTGLGDTGDDDQTVQEQFIEEVDESQPAYPFGHTTFSGWDMDDRNQFGHWWRLENAAWRDPDTGIRQGPKSWNGSMWV